MCKRTPTVDIGSLLTADIPLHCWSPRSSGSTQILLEPVPVAAGRGTQLPVTSRLTPTFPAHRPESQTLQRVRERLADLFLAVFSDK